MSTDIRLAALDLDGTTFNSDKIITRHTQETIRRAIDAGVIVMPCTGRPFTALPQEFTSIPGVRYALTSNGAAIYDLFSGQKVYEDYIDRDSAADITGLFLQGNAMTEVFYDGRSWVDRTGYNRALYDSHTFPDWFLQYIRKYKTPVDDLADRVRSGQYGIEKIAASYDDPTCRQAGFDAVSSMDSVTVVWGTEFNIEVTSATATKGKSIVRFASRLGITPAQIMACGDNMNDAPMLAEAGLAVAMGNASEPVREMADFVTLSNDDDGVAYAIEKFILNR